MDEGYQKALRRIKKARETNKKSLTLSSLKLTSLPSEIEQLVNLTQLHLNHIQLISLPSEIGQLTQLTSLNLYNNPLTSLPSEIGKLAKLTALDLRHNELTSLPSEIGKLTQLTRLYLRDNQLTSLPSEIGKLTQLTSLNLYNNQLTSLPSEIGKLTQLTRLNLRNNQLTSLPSEIGKLRQLTELDLRDNQLTSLPSEIGKLRQLTELYLRDNQLTSLPSEIGKLTQLTRLDLRNNQFEVGEEVYNLSPQEQIQEILKWQEAKAKNQLQSIHEAKVIFIGESDYGKTHLIEYLQKGKIDREINTTHGIERSHMPFYCNDHDIKVNFWDLGGQEFMRSTHQFFFSERTLYVLVTLARRERNELNHWLKLAQELGKNAPVIVVINKIDKNTQDIDRASIERDYPNVKAFVRTTIYDCKERIAKESITELHQKIQEIISDEELMPSVFEQRRPEWFTVKEALEEKARQGMNYISYSEFEQLEFIRDLPPDERRRNLHLLSILGTVVSFVDDPRLMDTNVINPQWIMDGVYTIINDPIIKDQQKGRLHIRDLSNILSAEQFPRDRHYFLLELLQKFNLVYPSPNDRDVFFIPDLFEDKEPEPPQEWKEVNESETLHFRYNYDDYPPEVFMRQFIVHMHRDIIGEKRWLSGVYISNGYCHAKVYQSFRKNYIHIEVKGNNYERRRYLYSIRQAFRRLHQPFDMLIVEEIQYKNHWLSISDLERFEEKKIPFYHVALDEILPISKILEGYQSSNQRVNRSDVEGYDIRWTKEENTIKKPVIVLAYSNDKDTYLEHIEEERKQTYEALRPHMDENKIHVEKVETTTINGCFHVFELYHNQITIFHFSGHAAGKYLLFKDRQANTDGLAQLLGQEQHLSLVFLNGCATKGQVADLLDNGVKAVIATSSAINDTKAMEFASQFYTSIANQKTIKVAFETARSFLKTKYAAVDVAICRKGLRLKNEERNQVCPWGLYVLDDGDLEWRLDVM